MKTTKDPSRKKKPPTGPSRGLRTQIKNDLKCILGCCNHAIDNPKCRYTKIVDAADPAGAQYKLIVKMIEKELKEGK